MLLEPGIIQWNLMQFREMGLEVKIHLRNLNYLIILTS